MTLKQTRKTGEPPAVVRARERLLRAALRVNPDATWRDWDALTDAACDYADAVENAEAKLEVLGFEA